jgi:peptidoglycan/xylan/chitin deacetylase (PgdA/CDA1 family)
MHWRIRRISGALRDLVNTRLARQPLPISYPGGLVSFTFDDGLQSAITAGRQILEKHKFRGTFYISGAFSGRGRPGARCFTDFDILDLIKYNHEIGCHTFQHRPVSQLSNSELRRQLDLNQAYVESLAPGYSLVSFAYPRGSVRVGAKRVLKHYFSSSRGSAEGLNIGNIDRSLLRANRIYTRLRNIDALTRLVELNHHLGGWLIFCTHDVTASPSSYGCCPEDLERLVHSAAGSGSKVVPIRDAIHELVGTNDFAGADLREPLHVVRAGSARRARPHQDGYAPASPVTRVQS